MFENFHNKSFEDSAKRIIQANNLKLSKVKLNEKVVYRTKRDFIMLKGTIHNEVVAIMNLFAINKIHKTKTSENKKLAKTNSFEFIIHLSEHMTVTIDKK